MLQLHLIMKRGSKVINNFRQNVFSIGSCPVLTREKVRASLVTTDRDEGF